MKKGFLFFAAICAALCVFAQPTLQNNVFPNIGDVATINTGDTLISEGSAGASQTWDFSSLTPLAGTTATQYQYVAVAGTPFAADFPTANIVGKTLADTAAYSYLRKESGQLSLLGSASLDFKQAYTDPNIVLKVPLNFNGSFSDDYAFTIDAGAGFIFESAGSHTITYDAYGTLKTPLGNFNNAIRTKSISVELDSADISGFTVISQTNTTTYDWFVPNRAGSVVSISYTSGISETRIPGVDTIVTPIPVSKSVSYTSAATTSVFDAPTTLSGLTITAVGPNPATDQLTLRFQAETSNQSLRLLITDVTGKMIENQSIRTVTGDNTLVIPVNQLAAGNYFLTLTDGRGVLTQSWIKQ